MRKPCAIILLIVAGLAATPAVLGDIPGFGDGTGFTRNPGGAGLPTVVDGTATMTTQVNNQASSIYYDVKQGIELFTASFDYQFHGGSANPADGAAFVLQNQANNALGAAGGGLGYQGITNSVAALLNIYAPNTRGVQGGAGGAFNTPYIATGDVDLMSGNPIRVTVDYNNYEVLLQLEELDPQDAGDHDTFSTSFNFDVPAAVGDTSAWVGFTGATGGQNAEQTISNFSYTYRQLEGTLYWDKNGDNPWGSQHWTSTPGGTGEGPPNDATHTVLEADNTNIVTVGAGGGQALSLTVGGGGIDIAVGQTLSVVGPVSFAADTTLTLAANAGLGAGGGAVDTITAAGAANLGVSRGILTVGSYTYTGGGDSQLVKSGAGTLMVNDYDATPDVKGVQTLKIEAGTVELRGSDPLAGADSVELAGGRLSLGSKYAAPVGATANALMENYYNIPAGFQSQLIEPLGHGLGLMAMSSAYSDLYRDGLDLNFGDGAIPPRSGGAIGADNFGSVWYGTLRVMAPDTGRFEQLEEGLVTFATNSDDGNTLYIDDQLVVANNPPGAGHGMGAGERRWGTVYLTAGDHSFFFGQYENGGGDGAAAKFAQGNTVGDWDNMIFVAPGKFQQQSMWHSGTEVIEAPSLANKTVVVSDGGELNLAGFGTLDVGTVSLQKGVLTTSGGQKIVIANTDVPQGTTGVVGFNTLTNTDPGLIDAHGSNVTITTDGTVPLLLDKANTGLQNATFKVIGGTLKLVTDSTSLGGAAVELAGGTFQAEGTVTNVNPPAGALGYWNFDDDNANDSSGNNHHGTNNGGSFDDTDLPPGAAGKCLDLTGGNNWVDVDTGGTQDVFDLGTAMTVAAWVKGAPSAGWSPYISKNGEENGWQMRRNGRAESGTDGLDWTTRGVVCPNDPNIPGNLNDNGDFEGISLAIHDGEWHHIAGTYDGTFKRIYVDGVLDNEIRVNTPGSAIRATTSMLVFGARRRAENTDTALQDAHLFLDGKFDEIFIYNRGLTTAEIVDLVGERPLDMGDVPLSVSESSTLRANASSPVPFGHLTLVNGSLTITGNAPAVGFDGTSVDPAATGVVGVDLQVDTDLGLINGNGASATFAKSGPFDLVLFDEHTGLDNLTIAVQGGRLVGVHGVIEEEKQEGNPFGTAGLQIDAGELVLAGLQDNWDVHFDNELSVQGDGTLTVGSGGVGGTGPLTVTLGNAVDKKVTLNAGTVTVRTTDDYKLNIPGSVSGAGNMEIIQGDVTVEKTINIGDLNLLGGTLHAGDAITADNFNVSSKLELFGVGAQRNITINPDGTLNLVGSNLDVEGATLTVPQATVSVAWGRTLVYDQALTVGNFDLAGSYRVRGVAPGSRDLTITAGGELKLSSGAILNMTGLTQGVLTATDSDITVEDGELKVGNAFSANNITVRNGFMHTTEEVTVNNMAVTGGIVNTDGSHVLVNEGLQLGEAVFGMATGQLQASGPDFLRDVELLIEGGTLNITPRPAIHLNSMDIGNPAEAGSTTVIEATGRHTILGGGHDIWDAADDFHFAYLPVQGDTEIITNVASLDLAPGYTGLNGWAKAGVMIRDKLTAGSINSFTCVSPSNGVPAQGRETEDQNAGVNVGAGGGQAAPYWVRLLVEGNTVTQYRSGDSVTTPVGDITWEQIDQRTMNLTGGNYAGLAVTSHDDADLVQAVLERVFLNGVQIGVIPNLVVNHPGTNLRVTATTTINANTDMDVVLGNLLLENGADLPVSGVPSLSFNNVTNTEDSTIEAPLFVRGVLAPGGDGIATLTIGTPVTGGLELSDFAQYACDVGESMANDQVVSTKDAYLSGTLTLKAIAKLEPPTAPGVGWYGDQTRTILSTVGESGIAYTFLDQPAEIEAVEVDDRWQAHCGHGVFLTNQGANGQGVTYEINAVKVDLFQAANGDVDGDRDVDSTDIQLILGANTFNNPEKPADFPTGDFDGDGWCNSADIQLLLAMNLFDTGPYAAPQPAPPIENLVRLIISPAADGLQNVQIDTGGLAITSYLISSADGALSGQEATNLGLFTEDDDFVIAGAGLSTLLDGVHDLGAVLGPGLDSPDGLSLTYTIAGVPGVYQGRLELIPEPGTVVMLLTGAMGLLWLAIRRRRTR